MHLHRDLRTKERMLYPKKTQFGNEKAKKQKRQKLTETDLFPISQAPPTTFIEGTGGAQTLPARTNDHIICQL